MTTSKKRTEPGAELVPTESGGLAEADDLGQVPGRLVEQARVEGTALTGDGGLLPALVAWVLETGLQAEAGLEPQAHGGTGLALRGEFLATVE